MNQRERFIRTLTCDNPDRPSYGDYLAYESTQRRWESEGLPEGLDRAGLHAYFGFDRIDIWGDDRYYLNEKILPGFEERIIEDTPEFTVSTAYTGHVVKVLKNELPPAMPQFLSYPVTDRKSWDAHKQRLDPGAVERLPAPGGIETAERDTPLGVWLGGTYGLIRDLMGVEGASFAFYDDPSLIEDMVSHLTCFYSTLLSRALATGLDFDWAMFWEDLAYNHGSLVSPEMFTKYCMPFYFTIIDVLRQNGIKVIMLDSDGNIEGMIPLWLDAGINVMHPMEVAAGMDVRAVRKQYGTRASFLGGISKKALAAGREAIDAEVIPKLKAMQDTGGGLVAECDHAVPPDVSLDNYRYFRDLVRKLSE